MELRPYQNEARLAILESKSEEAHSPLSEDVLQFLAGSVSGNVRQLQGILVYLGAQARLAGEELTVAKADRLLRKNAGRREKQLILQAVCDHFDLSADHLRAKKRDKTTALARHVAMYLLRQDAGYSFAEIGKELGNRNHATVLHGYQKIAGQAESSQAVMDHLRQIRERIVRQRPSPVQW